MGILYSVPGLGVLRLKNHWSGASAPTVDDPYLAMYSVWGCRDSRAVSWTHARRRRHGVESAEYRDLQLGIMRVGLGRCSGNLCRVGPSHGWRGGRVGQKERMRAVPGLLGKEQFALCARSFFPSSKRQRDTEEAEKKKRKKKKKETRWQNVRRKFSFFLQILAFFLFSLPLPPSVSLSLSLCLSVSLDLPPSLSPHSLVNRARVTSHLRKCQRADDASYVGIHTSYMRTTTDSTLDAARTMHLDMCNLNRALPTTQAYSTAKRWSAPYL